MAQKPKIERRFPLDVLVVAGHMHAGAGTTMGLMEQLRLSPAVRSYGADEDEYEILQLLRQGSVNTIFVDPQFLFWDAAPFIKRVREEFPRVVFVIYAEPYVLDLFCKKGDARFRNYFYLDHIITQYHDDEWMATSSRKYMRDASRRLDIVLRKCETWHTTLFKYDVAISFAGTDRQPAHDLAKLLMEQYVRVFYDQDEEANLLGRNLYTYLYEIYAHESRYCLMLVSKAYAERAWTNHERAAAQERAFKERGSDYLLPVRLDDTNIPGLPSTVGYVHIDNGIRRVADLVIEKLWITDSHRPKGLIGTSRI